MPKLFEILSKAYEYTKNHKFLWFFGFFLTWNGALNFLRHVDLGNINFERYWNSLVDYITASPWQFVFSVLLVLLAILISFSLGTISRIGLIYAALHLERKQLVTLHGVLSRVPKYFVRVLKIALIISLIMLMIVVWVGLPIYYIFSHGFLFRGVMVSVTGFLIFIPLMVALSLVNFFAACFVVVYDLKYNDAVKSSIDLISRYWDRTIGLLIVLFAIYVLLFLFSASVLGFIGVFAYSVAIMLKSISVPFYFGIMNVLFLLIVVALLTVNAILNVFNNLAWTLFFLKIVKAKRYPEEEAVEASPLMGG